MRFGRVLLIGSVMAVVILVVAFLTPVGLITAFH